MVYPYDKGMFVQRVVSPFKTFHRSLLSDSFLTFQNPSVLQTWKVLKGLTILWQMLCTFRGLIVSIHVNYYYYGYYLFGQDFNKHTTIQETNICLLLKSYDT